MVPQDGAALKPRLPPGARRADLPADQRGVLRVIVIGRGSVQQEECDVMGHMNVRHYVARVADAMAWLLLEAGLPPARGALVVRDQHIRFLRELAPGTPFTLLGGVLEMTADRLRAFVEIRNTATAAPAATFVTDLAAAAGPLPAGLRVESLRVALPDHAAPRGLSFASPRPLPDRAAALAMGLAEAYRGAVRPHECDAEGIMRPDGVIARVWDGVPNLRNRGTGLGVKEEGVGSAALEYRLVHLEPLRAGQLLTVTSGLRAMGEKTSTWTHLLHDGPTGRPVAAAEALGVAFDLVARRAIPIPPAQRAALEGLLVPGLGL
jgi:acyl-CoA thioester hydrolase